MAHRVTLTLSDDEYAALAAAAADAGEPVEALLRETVANRFLPRPAPPTVSPARYALSEYLYSMGFALNVPTGDLDTPAEEAEEEELAKRLSHGRPLSEMIIEDRGPY